jgi:antirestriction protein ArdC
LPKSLATGREYRGMNLLLLSTTEFSSGYWLTYREALKLGGHVRKGERATPVVYWKWRTPEEIQRLIQVKGIADPAPCVPFTSAVFNLDQVEGVERPPRMSPRSPNRGWPSRKVSWRACAMPRRSCTASPSSPPTSSLSTE